MTWDKKASLQTGRSQTADGRRVFALREVILDGRPMLTGQVTIGKPSPHGLIKSKAACWSAGGLGLSHEDDLVDEIPEEEQATRFRRRID